MRNSADTPANSSTGTSSVIDAARITRRFGDKTAVDHVSLKVGAGEIFGLLGPNAAGKSTMIRLLSGIIQPDGGGASVLGYDLVSQRERIKASIGYVAQSFALYPELSVLENIDFYSAIYQPISKAARQQLLADYGLEQFAGQRAGQLSGGYKRRLSIACAMAHDPELIFFDEPTAGIDPVTRKQLWEQFYNMAAEGKTLFVTTHYMEEAERCSRLAFLHHGRLVAQGSPTEIIASFGERQVYTCAIAYHPALSHALQSMPGVQVLNQYGKQLRIITDMSVSADSLQRFICGYVGEAVLTIAKAAIEDVFIALTQEVRES